MRTDLGTWPRVPALYGSALGFAGGVVATLVAVQSPSDGLTAPILTVALVSAGTTVLGALSAAAQTWLLYASFIIGHTGQLAVNDLTWHAAAMLLAAALVMTTAGAIVRWSQRPRAAQIPPPRQPITPRPTVPAVRAHEG